MIRHDPYLTEDEKVRYSVLPQTELAELILQQGIAGNFEEYLTGKKRFEIPVYAVWGNHEAVRIIDRLRAEPLHNLTFLDEKTSILLEGVRLYGLGGMFNEKNLLMHKNSGIAWVQSQVKSTLWQYADLTEMLDSFPADETRIQITHCDPMAVRTSFLEAFACRCGASLTFSGHMHRQENQQRSSLCGNADEVFRSYAARYPSALWEKLLKPCPAKVMEHVNLSPAHPLIVEISGSTYKIQ